MAGCSFQAPQDRIREFSQAEPGFVIYKSDISFARVDTENADSWQARAQLNIQICLTRTFGWRIMEPGIPFDVELADSPTGTGHGQHFDTLPDGCMEFTPSLSFPYAQKTTQYLKKYLIVRGQRQELQGMVRTRAIYIDPWNKTVLKEWNEALNGYPKGADSGPVQLRAHGLTLHETRSREIIVDKDMKLYFRYHYALSFFDQYARLHSLSDSPRSDSVWPGTRFAIRGALVAPPSVPSALEPEDTSAFTMLGGFTTVATADANGEVTAEIALQVDLEDIPFLDSRPRLVFDISPISSTNIAPDEANLVLLFDPRQEQATYVPELSHFAAHAFFQRSPEYTVVNDSRQSALNLLVKPRVPTEEPVSVALTRLNVRGAIQQISPDQPAKTGDLTADEIRSAVAGQEINPDFLRHFAYLYNSQPEIFPGLPQQSDRARFLEDPELFVHWAKFTAVDSLNPLPETVTANSQTLAVVANLFKQAITTSNQSDGERSTAASEIADNRSMGFNAFGNGRNWSWAFQGREEKYKMHEVILSQALMAQKGMNRITNFYADRLRVELRGHFRDCLILSFNLIRADANDTNYIFCEPRSGTIQESYFFVTDEFRANVFSFLEFRNLQERQLVKLFRGEAAFNAFVGVLQDAGTTQQFEPVAQAPAPESLPGIHDLRVSTDIVRPDNKLRGFVMQLVQTMKNHPAINGDELYAYFSLAQSSPKQIFSTPEGQTGFTRLGQLLLKDRPEARRPYSELLAVLYTTLKTRRMSKEADWVFKYALEVNQK